MSGSTGWWRLRSRRSRVVRPASSRTSRRAISWCSPGPTRATDQPVASFLIKRALDTGARLITVEEDSTDLSVFAEARFPLAEAAARRTLRPRPPA